MAGAVGTALFYRREWTLLVGADRDEGVELAVAGLRDYRPVLGKNYAAAHRNLRGGKFKGCGGFGRGAATIDRTGCEECGQGGSTAGGSDGADECATRGLSVRDASTLRPARAAPRPHQLWPYVCRYAYICTPARI